MDACLHLVCAELVLALAMDEKDRGDRTAHSCLQCCFSASFVQRSSVGWAWEDCAPTLKVRFFIAGVAPSRKLINSNGRGLVG